MERRNQENSNKSVAQDWCAHPKVNKKEKQQTPNKSPITGSVEYQKRLKKLYKWPEHCAIKRIKILEKKIKFTTV